MTTYTLTLIAEGRDSASGPLGRVSSALGNMAQIAGGILGAGIIQNLGNQIVEFGRKAIGATADMQSLQISLENLVARELRTSDSTMTMTQALQQAAPAAGNLLNQIRSLAIQSPYRLDTVNETFRLAMAFGFASDEAVSFTRAILDMSAGVGASDEMMGRMAYNLAQIRMQGKVTAVDVRQLAMAGFDLVGALRAIGEQHGVAITSIEDFNAAIESGKLKWEDFAKDFEKYANEQFGGAAKRMSQTLEGLKSTFADVFSLTMPKILQPALDKITKFLQDVSQRFIDFSNSGVLDDWGQSIADSFAWVDTLKGFMDTLFRQLDVGQSMFEALRIAIVVNFGRDTYNVIASFFSGISSVIAVPMALLGQFSGKIQGLGSLKLPGFTGDSTTVLEGIKSAFDGFAQFFKEQGPKLQALANLALGGLLNAFANLAQKVVPWAVEQLDKFSAWLVENGPLISEYAAMLTAVFTGVILPALVGFWDVVAPLLSGVLDLILNLATLTMQVATGDWSGAWETMKQVVVDVWNAISASFMAFVDWIANILGSSWAEIAAVWAADWQMFQQIVAQVWEIIKSTVAMKFAEIRAVVAQKFEEVKALAAAALAGMAAAISSGMSIVKSAMMFVINAVIDYIYSRNGEFFQRAQGWLIQMKTGIIANIGIVVNAIETLIAAVLASIVPIVIPIVYSYPGAPHIPGQTGGGGGGGTSGGGGGGTSGGGTCFVGHTTILMADGDAKPINMIIPGDRVISWDHEKSRHVVATVTSTQHHSADEINGYWMVNGTGVTGEHLVLVGNEWKSVDDLQVGDVLTGMFGEGIPVRSKWWIPVKVGTFNFHTDNEVHNYLADGFVAHNSEKAARGIFDFVVPPGYKENYPIYASSGEVVNISNPGSYRGGNAQPSGSGLTVVFSEGSIVLNGANPQMDVDFMAQEISRRIRAAQR